MGPNDELNKVRESVTRHDEQIKTLFRNLIDTGNHSADIGDKILTKMDIISNELKLIQGAEHGNKIEKLGTRVSLLEKWQWGLVGVGALIILEIPIAFQWILHK